MQVDIHPYEGNEPFVFVSYAHKDTALAEPVVQWLNDNNYRIWFDKGIHSGEFALKIEERLEKSFCVIALLTDNYIDSINCRNEINYAIKNNITILPICLNPTQLRYGMNLQLVSYHFIYRYQLTEKQFYEELKHSPEIQKAHKDSGADSSPNSELPTRPHKTRKTGGWKIGLAALLVCLVCVGGIWISDGFGKTPEQEDTESKPQNQMNIRNEFSSMTAYDKEIIVEMTIKTWKPLAHLGYDVTVAEVLSAFYDTVKFDNNRVTAQKDGESIQFSVQYRINADGSYSVDDYSQTIFNENIFYDCYMDGSAVAAEEVEEYLCDLIIQMP